MTLLFVDSAVEARADVEAVEAVDSVEQPDATMIEVDRSDNCSSRTQVCGPGIMDCCEGYSCLGMIRVGVCVWKVLGSLDNVVVSVRFHLFGMPQISNRKASSIQIFFFSNFFKTNFFLM